MENADREFPSEPWLQALERNPNHPTHPMPSPACVYQASDLIQAWHDHGVELRWAHRAADPEAQALHGPGAKLSQHFNEYSPMGQEFFEHTGTVATRHHTVWLFSGYPSPADDRSHLAYAVVSEGDALCSELPALPVSMGGPTPDENGRIHLCEFFFQGSDQMLLCMGKIGKSAHETSVFVARDFAKARALHQATEIKASMPDPAVANRKTHRRI